MGSPEETRALLRGYNLVDLEGILMSSQGVMLQGKLKVRLLLMGERQSEEGLPTLSPFMLMEGGRKTEIRRRW